MKIVHFIHRIPPEYSGAGKQALLLIKWLSLLGLVENEIIAYTQIESQTLNTNNVKTIKILIEKKIVKKAIQLSTLFVSLFKAKGDILHVHGYYLPIIIFGKLLKMKIVLKTTLHGVDDLHTIHFKKHNLLIKYLIHQPISLNERMRLSNDLIKKSKLIPNGVESERYIRNMTYRKDIREKLLIDDDCCVFLYNGGDSERKGSKRLFNIWSKICESMKEKNIILIVLGNFKNKSTQSTFKEQFKQANIKFIFQVVEDIEKYYSASDVLLFLSKNEGLPNSVLEAAIANMFIVAQNIPNTYTGILCKDNSIVYEKFSTNVANDVCTAIKSGLHLNINNQEIATHYHISKIANTYFSLYQEI